MELNQSTSRQSLKVVWAKKTPRDRQFSLELVALVGLALVAVLLHQPVIWFPTCQGCIISTWLMIKPGEPESNQTDIRIALAFLLGFLLAFVVEVEYLKHPHRPVGRFLEVIAVCLCLHMFYLRWSDAKQHESHSVEASV